MEVILLKTVENVGHIGQKVSVSRGYARNYLVPRGLALEASEGAVKVAADKIRLEQKRDLKRKDAAEAIRAQYAGKDFGVTISAQAGDEDQLYGSVTAREIVAALALQNLELETKQVLLAEPIKVLGDYEVPVKLHPEVEIIVKVHVTRAS
jgi:large subunit ribosomal protein L9